MNRQTFVFKDCGRAAFLSRSLVMNLFSRRDFLTTSAALLATQGISHAQGRSPLVCGQIGTAHPHASGKLLALRDQPELWQVAGLLVEKDPAVRDVARHSLAYRGLNWLEKEEELLAVPDLKMVAVETALADATETALRVIEAGKHVHLDKPGGIDHEAFKGMRRLAEERGLMVQMGYMLRYNPAFTLLFQAVKDGWLGEITEIDASMGKLGDEKTRQQITEQPGGAMFEIGCHLIDAVVTLLGPPQQVEAFSTPTRDDGVPDNQLAVLLYPKATVTVRANFADPFGGPRRRFNVTGTEGSFEILPLESGQVKLSLTLARGDYKKGTQELDLEVPKGRYDLEFADFAAVVRAEKKLAWDAAHDIAVHETSQRAAGLL
jgi:predicted dehydrogenase